MPHLVLPATNTLDALDHASGLTRCGRCGMAEDKWTASIDIPVRRGPLPALSLTRDGLLIATPAFRARARSEGWRGLAFRSMRNGAFHVRALRRVRIVTEQRWFHALDDLTPGLSHLFEGRPRPGRAIREHGPACPDCGLCPEIRLGDGSEFRIARGEMPVGDDEFVEMDAVFGAGDAQARWLVAGDAIGRSLGVAPFAGLSLAMAVGYEPWATGRPPVRGGGAVLPFPFARVERG